jgi:hypothetical protein
MLTLAPTLNEMNTRKGDPITNKCSCVRPSFWILEQKIQALNVWNGIAWSQASTKKIKSSPDFQNRIHITLESINAEMNLTLTKHLQLGMESHQHELFQPNLRKKTTIFSSH